MKNDLNFIKKNNFTIFKDGEELKKEKKKKKIKIEDFALLD